MLVDRGFQLKVSYVTDAVLIIIYQYLISLDLFAGSPLQNGHDRRTRAGEYSHFGQGHQGQSHIGELLHQPHQPKWRTRIQVRKSRKEQPANLHYSDLLLTNNKSCSL